MFLRLQHKSSGQYPVSAAFLHGNDPAEWLRTIGDWNISPGQLELYALSSSRESIDPQGLLVVFPDPALADGLDLLNPYICIAERLFIPAHTSLYPQMTDDELTNILIWKCQLFHPAVGFVGFDARDRIKAESFFRFPVLHQVDWSFANAGNPASPRLTKITVQEPTVYEIVKSLGDDVEQKPLDQIPVDNQEKASGWTDRLRKGLLDISRSFMYGQDKEDTTDQPDLRSKLLKWFRYSANNTKSQREQEIERLLDLFNKNSEEALKYAPSLESPYANRNQSDSLSNKLGRQDTNFSLASLGGSRGGEVWDISNYYSRLHAKYVEIANDAIAKKNFRKAAYIHANLLGDYHAAANVLAQGKFYREAAAIYKNYLGQPEMAATYMEAGGFYDEAAELYASLGKNEMAGDVFAKIFQQEKADFHYEKCVQQRISAQNYLDAARVIQHKIKDDARAKTMLLTGWQHRNSKEACLRGYIDLVQKIDSSSLGNELQEIYRKYTPTSRDKVSFLNVMEYANGKVDDKYTEKVINDIVYEVISAEAEAGRLPAVLRLRRFLSEDPLIASEAARYLSTSGDKGTVATKKTKFELDQHTTWMKAVWQCNQFVAIGLKNNMLQLARGDWDGNLEYYAWTKVVPPALKVDFISAPYYSPQIFLATSPDTPVSLKVLPESKYFPEKIVVRSPAWFYEQQSLFAVNDKKQLAALTIGHDATTLSFYDFNGELQQSVSCQFDDYPPRRIQLSHHRLYYRNNYYYTFLERQLIVLREDGKGTVFNTGSRILEMAASLKADTGEHYLLVCSEKENYLFTFYDNSQPQNTGMVIPDTFREPSLATFISDKLFVMAKDNKAMLFNVEDNNVQFMGEFGTKTPICAALATMDRKTFMLLEATGQITSCEIPMG